MQERVVKIRHGHACSFVRSLAACATKTAVGTNSYAPVRYFPLGTFCVHVRPLIRTRNPRNEHGEHRLLADRENHRSSASACIAREIAEEDRKHTAPAHSRSVVAEFRSLRKLAAAQSNTQAREIIDIRPASCLANNQLAA